MSDSEPVLITIPVYLSPVDWGKLQTIKFQLANSDDENLHHIALFIVAVQDALVATGKVDQAIVFGQPIGS
jgi:hypothetical protein